MVTASRAQNVVTLTIALIVLSATSSNSRGAFEFPQLWEIYDNPGHVQTLSNGVDVTVEIETIGTAQNHSEQGGTELVGSDLWTVVGANPPTSYDNNWNAAAGKAEYKDYIATIVSFDRPVNLTGNFLLTDVDWYQMVSVFGLNESDLVEPASVATGFNIVRYPESAQWLNHPVSFGFPDNQIDTLIGSGGSDPTDTSHRVSYGFLNADLTDLVFVFAEAYTGGDSGNGGALVWVDFDQENAGVTAAPEPYSACLVMVGAWVLMSRRRRTTL